MACKCGKTDCKSSGDSTTDVPRAYDGVISVMYGVSTPWDINPTPGTPYQWYPPTGVTVTNGSSEPKAESDCAICVTVEVLQNVINMLLKRIDTLENEVTTLSARPKKTNKNK